MDFYDDILCSESERKSNHLLYTMFCNSKHYKVDNNLCYVCQKVPKSLVCQICQKNICNKCIYECFNCKKTVCRFCVDEVSNSLYSCYKCSKDAT